MAFSEGARSAFMEEKGSTGRRNLALDLCQDLLGRFIGNERKRSYNQSKVLMKLHVFNSMLGCFLAHYVPTDIALPSNTPDEYYKSHLIRNGFSQP